MPRRCLRALSVLVVPFFLAGCGSGGGDDGPVASTETFPLKTAWVQYVTNSSSQPFNVSGTVDGVKVSGSGNVTRGNLQNATFEGAVALRKTTTITATVSAAGQSASISSTVTTYVDTNYAPLGSTEGEYGVVNQPATIPDTAKVGDTGIWYTEVRYPHAGKPYSLGTDTVSYVMEPDTASTALLKLIVTRRDVSNNITANSTVALRVSTTGSLTWISESALIDGNVITMHY